MSATCTTEPDGRSFAVAADSALRALFDKGRRAIRIVDFDCRSGARLIAIARCARAMGFLSVEARGCARSERAVVAARQASVAARDPGIGWEFDRVAVPAAIASEESGADVVLVSRDALHGGDVRKALLDLVGEALIVVDAVRPAEASRALRRRPARAPVLPALPRKSFHVAA